MTQANNNGQLVSRNNAIVSSQNAINEARKEVQLNFPSIYTKEDVLHILSQLEGMIAHGITNLNGENQQEAVTTELHISDSIKADLIDAIVDEINCLDIKDYIEIDYSSATFSLSGNEIELDSVDFEEHGSGWDRDIKRICNEVFDSYIEEAKMNGVA